MFHHHLTRPQKFNQQFSFPRGGGNHASVCTSFEMQKAMCFLCSAKKSKHQLFYINILNKFATEIKLGGVAMSQSNQMSS